jgi:hypothetical protein
MRFVPNPKLLGVVARHFTDLAMETAQLQVHGDPALGLVVDNEVTGDSRFGWCPRQQGKGDSCRYDGQTLSMLVSGHVFSLFS